MTGHLWTLGDPKGINPAFQEPTGCRGGMLQGLGRDPKLIEALRSREASGEGQGLEEEQ